MSKVLKPYQIFNPTEIVKEIVNDYEAIVHNSDEDRFRDLILLSGPPGAGKTHLSKFIAKGMGLACGIVNPSQGLYSMMRMAALPETHLSYAEFKALPMGRQRLICAADVFRKEDENIFNKFCVTLPAWQQFKALVVDNVGFESELLFFDRIASDLVFIEILEPFAVTKSRDRARQELPYSAAVRAGTSWPGDSRKSLTNVAGQMFKVDQAMAFLSSQYAIQMLNRQVFNGTGQTPGYEGTAHGRLLRMKKRNWITPGKPPAIRDLFDSKRG